MRDYDPFNPDQQRVLEARVKACEATNPKPGVMGWWRWWIYIAIWLPIEIFRFLSEHLVPFAKLSLPILTQYGPWALAICISIPSLWYGLLLYENRPAIFHRIMICVSLVAGVIALVQLQDAPSLYLLATFILTIAVGIYSLASLRNNQGHPKSDDD